MKQSAAAVDFNYLLLDYYKKLKISEKELAVILMIYHLQQKNNTLITNEMLALKMSMDAKEIDQVFSRLLERGYISFEETPSGEIYTSIDFLVEKLYEYFTKEIVKDNSNPVSKDMEAKINHLYDEFEKAFKRSLFPAEIDRIDEWIRSGYSVEIIEYALKDSVMKNEISIRLIDRNLKNLKKEKDNFSEGFTMTDSKVSDEETQRNIELLKEDWTKNG